MEINGVIRINMTGAEIEAALLKAHFLPTDKELQASLDNLQEGIDTKADAEATAAALATKATKDELTEGLATKQDTLEFATDEDIEQAFGDGDTAAVEENEEQE